jgi:hypothetical protein
MGGSGSSTKDQCLEQRQTTIGGTHISVCVRSLPNIAHVLTGVLCIANTGTYSRELRNVASDGGALGNGWSRRSDCEGILGGGDSIRESRSERINYLY